MVNIKHLLEAICYKLRLICRTNWMDYSVRLLNIVITFHLRWDYCLYDYQNILSQCPLWVMLLSGNIGTLEWPCLYSELK